MSLAEDHHATPAARTAAEALIDRIENALDLADQTFGYEAELTGMVDRIATYELRIGGEVLRFTDNDDATASHQYQVHVARARARHRAQAVVAALEAYEKLGLSGVGHLPEAIRALPGDRLREEVWAWRQDAAARIRGMMCSAKASDERGEEDRAIDIRVNFLNPSAVALASYIEGDFHEGCEACGKPLLHGQQVWPVEDANDVHVSCWPGPIVQDGVEIASYTYSDYDTPESVAAIAAEALAYCRREMGLDDQFAGGTCRYCGCTDDRACETPEGPCRWIAEDVCSAPNCLDQYSATFATGEADQ